MSSLRKTLNKPLKPIFVTPASQLDFQFSDEYYPVILVTASMFIPNGHERMNGFVYVQGAADDEESWAHGLTSSLFWEHCNNLIYCTTNEQTVRMIHEIVGLRKDGIVDDEVSPIGLSRISLGLGVAKLGETCIVCGTITTRESESLHLPVPSKTAKQVVTMTKEVFPTSISFAIKHGILNGSPISVKATNPSRETVDLSIAITLVLLCLFFDNNGIPSMNLLT
jgi:hypothetical protein